MHNNDLPVLRPLEIELDYVDAYPGGPLQALYRVFRSVSPIAAMGSDVDGAFPNIKHRVSTALQESVVR
jgi:hypothetical protein